MYGADESGSAISPSEFEEINKLIRSFHLSTEECIEENELNFQNKDFEITNRDYVEFVKSPSEDSGVDSNNERIIRRRKKVTQQKEKKRNKIVKENGSPLLGNFDDDGISLIQDEKLMKANVKSRKTLRKKFNMKPNLNNENYVEDYQDQNTSPPICLSPGENFEAGCDPPIYYDHPFLEELALPSYSGHSLPEASMKCSYFTHSTPTLTSSYSHRFHLNLPTSETSHVIHNNAELTSHSPIFVPALPEGASHSPMFNLQTSCATSKLHGLEESQIDVRCNAVRDPERAVVNYAAHRGQNEFRNTAEIRDQMNFTEHRNAKRSTRNSSAVSQQQTKHKVDRRTHIDAQKPGGDPRSLNFYPRSPRLDLTRRNDFKDVLEETETETELVEQMTSSATNHRPSELRKVKEPDPKYCRVSKVNQNTQAQTTHTCPARGGRRSSIVVSDSRGRFHVMVKKTRPNLGIAIEGGSDTKYPLPRVINIAANGAAFEAGGLRVGQIILAVNGHRLEGKPHEEAARAIASAWTDREKSEIEFLVADRKPSEAELRRNSISLLSQTS